MGATVECNDALQFYEKNLSTGAEVEWAGVWVAKINTTGGPGGRKGELSVIKNKATGNFVYCVQPFIHYSSTEDYQAYYTRSDIESIMPGIDWDRVTLLTYYGYGYGSHTSKYWYGITQYLVWETVEENIELHFADSLDKVTSKVYNDHKYDKQIAEINNLIANHGIKPSFNISGNLMLGQTYSFNDNNNVLSLYDILSTTGCTATKNGNTLTITPTSLGSISVKLGKCTKEQGLVLYALDDSQNLVGRGALPVYSTVEASCAGGKITIVKVDKKNGSVVKGDARLQGAVYGVYDSNGNQVSTLTIGDDLKAQTDYLGLGTYTVREITAPVGYNLSNEVYTVTISTDTPIITIEVSDPPIESNLRIIKKISETDYDAAINIAGAQFKLTLNSDTNQVYYTDISGDDGVCSLQNIPYGTYTVEEYLVPNSAYKAENLEMSFKENGETYEYTVVDPSKEMQIEIIKSIRLNSGEITEAKLEGAEFTVYTDATCTTPYKDKNGNIVKIGPTDEKGYAISKKMRTGTYYLKETTFPTGIDPDATIPDEDVTYRNKVYTASADNKTQDNEPITVSLNIENEPIRNSIEITKYIGETSNSEKSPLAGAEFTATLISSNGTEYSVKCTAPTDENGYCIIENLPYGKYEIEETTVPSSTLKCSNFTLFVEKSEKELGRKYNLTDVKFLDAKSTLADVEKTWVDNDGNLVDTAKKMVIKVEKINEYGSNAGKTVDFTKGDAILKGAIYQIYKYNEETKDYTDFVYDITVNHQDNEGYWCAESDYLLVGDYGKYMVKEKIKSTEIVDGVTYNYSYAEGYLVDEKVYYFEQDSEEQVEEISYHKAISKEIPITGRGRIIKYNNDNNNDETKNDTDKDPSVGAKLRLRLVSAIGTDKEEENTYYATIDENGYAEFIDEEYAAIYPDDKNTIPYGTYQIDEVEASTNGTHTYFYMQPEKVTITKQHEVESRIISDEPISAYLKIIKKDADSKEEVHIAGAKYMVWDCQAGEFITQMLTPSGEYTNVFETNDEGYCYLPQKLYAGDYIVYEIEAPKGYYLDEAYRLPENEEDYGNMEKGGAKVTIDTMATGIVDGTVYDKNLNLSVDVEIYNTPKKARINVEKKGEVLTGATSTTNYDTGEYKVEEKEEKYTPTYTLKGLEGVEYQIIAVNDIKSPDERYTYVHANDVVDTLVTDENGYDETIPLYLGEYKIVETKTPKGYIKDENIENITLENNDELVPIKNYNKQLTNVRQKLQLTFKKVFEDLEYTTDENVTPKALFGVYTKNAIMDYTGKNVAIPANKLVDLIWTDENNDVTSQIDLPKGTYTIRELYVTYPYTKTVDEQTIMLEYSDDSSQSFVVKEGEKINNTPEYASITLVKLSTEIMDNIVLNGDKIDTTNLDAKTTEIINEIKGKTTEEIKEYFKENEIKCVANAEYTVYTDEECTKKLKIKNETTGKAEIAKLVTDESGLIELNNVPLGEYWIKETKAPEGYALSDEKIKIALDVTSKNTRVYQALVEKEVVPELLTKTDAFTGETVANCTFEIKEKETGKVLLHSVTNESGIAFIPLSLFENGKTYTYTEISAPDIYDLNTEPHDFVAKISEDGSQWLSEKLTVENRRKTRELIVRKTDADTGDLLEGCVFTIAMIDEETGEQKVNAKTGEPIYLVENAVTNENGEYVIGDAPMGTYKFTEIKAPEGYELDEDLTGYTFTINNDSPETIIFEVTNTGDIAVYALSAVALVSCLGIAYTVRKNRIKIK